MTPKLPATPCYLLQQQQQQQLQPQPPSSAASLGTGLELGNFGTAESHHSPYQNHHLTAPPAPLNFTSTQPPPPPPHLIAAFFPIRQHCRLRIVVFPEQSLLSPSVEISIIFQLSPLTEHHRQSLLLPCHQSTLPSCRSAPTNPSHFLFSANAIAPGELQVAVASIVNTRDQKWF